MLNISTYEMYDLLISLVGLIIMFIELIVILIKFYFDIKNNRL